jgi:hypothetical protein
MFVLIAILVAVALIISIVVLATKNINGSKITKLVATHTENEILQNGLDGQGIVDRCLMRSKIDTDEQNSEYYILYIKLNENKGLKHTISTDLTINKIGKFLNKTVKVKFLDSECVILDVD